MNYGICTYTLIPMRSQPEESAEMLSQLLYGESYLILEKNAKWLHIRTTFDQYEAWIDAKLHTPATSEELQSRKANHHIASNTFTYLNGMPLVAGSELPGQGEPIPQTSTQLLSFGQDFLNAPYLWGGRTILGIDCSGLTQLLFKLIGQAIPRDASQQVKIGETIEFLSAAQEGDLAFFDNPEGQITHVGLLLNNQTILHASGRVRTDKIDHQGIFNADTQTYSHQLRVIKRILKQTL